MRFRELSWPGTAHAGLRVFLVTGAAALVVALAPPPASAARTTVLEAEVDKGQKRIRATVTYRPNAVRFGVRLNGKRITDRFGNDGDGAESVHLGANDNLRFGTNRLRVVALRPNGRKVVRKVRFRVTRSRPLASAGRDQEAIAGDKVKLRGGRTTLARGSAATTLDSARAQAAAKLRYRWRIKRKPRGSRPDLRRARSANPRLKTDKHGTYLIELRTRRRGGGKARIDMASVAVQDSAAVGNGLLIGSTPRQSNGPADGLRIYGGADSRIIPTSAGSRQYAMLLFDSTTLELLNPTQIYFADGPNVGEEIGNLAADAKMQVPTGHGVLSVVQGSVGTGIASDQLAQVLNDVLGLGMAAMPPPGTPFMGVGRVGSLSNCNNKVVSWRGCAGQINLDDSSAARRTLGTIARDSQGNFAFSPIYEPAYGIPQLSFSTSTEASTNARNVMQIGAETYESETITGIGGFHLAVLDGTTAELVPLPGQSANRTYTFEVNPPGDTGDDVALNNLTNTLLRVSARAVAAAKGNVPDSSRLIMLQAFGSVYPANPGQDFASDWFKLGNVLAEQFGATRNALNRPVEAGNDFGLLGEPFAYGMVGSSLYSQVANTFQGETTVTSAEAAIATPELEVSGDSVELQGTVSGLLSRDTFWQLEPSGGAGTSLSATADDPGAYALGAAALHVDPANNPGLQPVPFPHAGEPQWEAALQYAAAQLGVTYEPADPGAACYYPPGGKSDLRSNYCGGPPDGSTWVALGGTLDGLAYPGASQGFSELTWEQMKRELINNEFPAIDRLNGVVGKFQQIFGAGDQVQALVDLEKTTGYINQQVRKSQNMQTHTGAGWWLGMFSDVFNVVGTLATGFSPLAGGVSTLIGGSLGIGESFANNGSGVPNLAPLLDSYDVGTIGSELTNRFDSASLALGSLRDQIASDAGKLAYFDQAIKGINIDDVAMADIARQFELAAQRYAYGLILPAAWLPRELLASSRNQDPLDVTTYECRHDGRHHAIFSSAPQASYYYDTYDTPDEIGLPSANPYVLVQIGVDPNGNSSALVPAGVMGPVFGMVQATSAGPDVSTSGSQLPLGFYKPFFYNRNFNSFRSPDRLGPTINCDD